MTIHRLLQDLPLEPEVISRATKAYGNALHKLGLVDRKDPIAEIIAKKIIEKIIEIAQTGVRSGRHFCSGDQGAWSSVRLDGL